MKINTHIRKTAICVVVLLNSFFAIAQYNIVMNLTKNPATEMAFNWFTDANTSCLQVRIVLNGVVIKTVPAVCITHTSTAYTSYIESKAIVTGLTPNTTYSFAIGAGSIWKNIGTFKTAPAPESKVPFSFIYVTDAHVEASLQPQTNAANTTNPNANFWVHCGDVISDENGALPTNKILELWKKFFEFQPNQIEKKPLAPVIGNHDMLYNNLFKTHFNVQNESFDLDGSTYSFIYGDAQFFAINTEKAYIGSLSTWMKAKIDNSVRWHIVCCHTPVYTSKYNGVYTPNMADLFDELNIDLALQGHTHVHDVMGPIKNRSVVQGAVKYVTSTTATVNSNGKSGGLFNVQQGTMYFTNGTFGLKWMPESYTDTSATNTTHITGKWAADVKMGNGATGFTYSNISVSSDNITITTYKANGGVPEFLDEIKLVKRPCLPSTENPVSQTINNSTTWSSPTTISNNIVIPSGKTLTVKAKVTTSNCSVIIVKSGGELIIDGANAILDGISVIAEIPSSCTIQNDGKVLLGEFDDFDIQLGAELNLDEGEVLVK